MLGVGGFQGLWTKLICKLSGSCDDFPNSEDTIQDIFTISPVRMRWDGSNVRGLRRVSEHSQGAA